MAKTIDNELNEEIKNRELLKKIAKRLPYPAPDLSNPQVYDDFCRRYGEAIAPEIRKVDLMIKRSMGQMFTRVVRGGYYSN